GKTNIGARLWPAVASPGASALRRTATKRCHMIITGLDREGSTAADPSSRRGFLLLQGPHGPFFDRLGSLLQATGAEVWRVAFNAGDEFFWSDPAHLIRHTDSPEDWPAHLDRILDERGVTDIVLYGDTRPVHAAAGQAARARGLV